MKAAASHTEVAFLTSKSLLLLLLLLLLRERIKQDTLGHTATRATGTVNFHGGVTIGPQGHQGSLGMSILAKAIRHGTIYQIAFDTKAL